MDGKVPVYNQIHGRNLADETMMRATALSEGLGETGLKFLDDFFDGFAFSIWFVELRMVNVFSHGLPHYISLLVSSARKVSLNKYCYEEGLVLSGA
jgi:hypothetical protein